MSHAATRRASASRSFPVGERTVTLTATLPASQRTSACTVAWQPAAPSALSASEWHELRAGRQVAIDEIAAELGVSPAAIDA